MRQGPHDDRFESRWGRIRLRDRARTTARVQEIVRVMVKHGLADWVRALHIDTVAPGVRKLLLRRTGRPPAPGASRWEILRAALEELGPTFIKLGQLMSNRSDVLPRQLVGELTRLQDNVAPIRPDLVRPAVEAELGRSIDAVFCEFDDHPKASASIAQVHRARLYSGQEVAVKLQRPGIHTTIETDLDIVEFLARLAERYVPASRHLNPTAMVKEFRRHLIRELDFEHERENMERFAAIFGGRNEIRVPATYRKHSGPRLLVMEYMTGSLLSAVLSRPPDEMPFDPVVAAERGANLTLEQILVHGFFHADPHPGNVMVLPGNVICYLDYGMMGRLHREERELLAGAISGMVARDAAKVTDAVLRMARNHDTVDYDVLVDEVQELVDDYLDRSLREVNIAELFTNLIGIVVGHGLSVPANLLMVAKALLTVEGVGRNMNPDFTLQPALEEAARRVVRNRLRPENLAREVSSVGLDYAQLLRALPVDLSGIARQLRGGQLSIGFRIRGIEPLRQTLDHIGYRLIFGIVLAAVMLSSALVIHAGLPPLWNGIPIIGIAGFAIAGILGMGFLFTIAARIFRRR